MKKLASTFILSTLICASMALANPSPNQFTNVFTVKAPAGAKLLKYATTGYIRLEKLPAKGPCSFKLVEDESWPIAKGGEAVVTLGKDDSHYCEFKILDRDWKVAVLEDLKCEGYKEKNVIFNGGYNSSEITIKK